MGNLFKKMNSEENKSEENKYEKMNYNERSNLLYSAIRDKDFELVKEICVDVKLQKCVLNFDEFSIDKYHVYNAIHSDNIEIAKFLFDNCGRKDHYFLVYCIKTIQEPMNFAKRIITNKELMRYFLNRESYYSGSLLDFSNYEERSLEKFIFDTIKSEYNELILEKLKILTEYIIPDISKIILEYSVSKL
jgi:hypothetical protein